MYFLLSKLTQKPKGVLSPQEHADQCRKSIYSKTKNQSIQICHMAILYEQELLSEKEL